MKKWSYYIFAFAYWILFIWFFSLSLIEVLLLFSFLIIVPLTLSLTETKDRHDRPFKSYQYGVLLGPIAAIIGSLAFAVEPIWLSVLFSIVWLMYTALIACYGLLRLMERGFSPSEETVIDIGLIYIFMGGLWYTISNTGYNVLDFGPTIIQLTAIHFHYSAFVVPIFVGLLGRLLSTEEKKAKGYVWLAAAVAISPIGVALGITLSRQLEFIFVAFYLLALWRYAWLVFTLKPLRNLRGAWLIRISSLFVVLTMILALFYAWGRIRQMITITIPDMTVWHGVGNAFGFIFLGVIGWLFISPSMQQQAYGIPFSKIRGRGKVGNRFLHQAQHLDQNKREIMGIVDQLSNYNREDFDTRLLHPLIREFYENTLSFELKSTTHWAKGFRLFSRLYARWSSKIGQLHLLPSSAEPLLVDSEIIKIDDEKDGRENVRAWVRTSRETKDTIFVALYSQHDHVDKKETYMNIGLPLPYSQMTGILRLDLLQPDRKDGNENDGVGNNAQRDHGLMLSSLPRRPDRGDEGIYLVTRWFAWRLPLHEQFTVEAAEDSSRLYATHQMWLFRYPFLQIQYDIYQKERGADKDEK